MLHEQELIKLRTGTAVFPILDSVNLAATKQVVWLLSRGIFQESDINFIASREAEIQENYPKFALNFIEEIKGNPSNRLPTFEEVYSELEHQIPNLIYQSVKVKISLAEAHEIYHRINSFPAIRSTLRANVYLSAICIIHQDVPGKDKNDDYRHVIEASYCDIFVTEDKQLSRTVPRINPDLEVLKGSHLF
jgi:hypothetical protein